MALSAKPKHARHRSRTTDEALAEVTKEPVKNLIIRVPESTARAFKTKTASEGKTMQGVLVQAIEAYIRQS